MYKIRAYADLHLYYNKDDMQRYDDNELAKLKEELILNPPNMLVFCGDLCHMPYKADDIRFINTIKFVTEVVNICRKKNIQFRIIQGTSSHDGKIVEILSNIFSNGDERHVKCFTTIAYENLSNGLMIRYLPEPYFDSYSNFKEYAFSEKADITFFHGSVDGVIPMISQKDSVTNLPKAVVIAQEDLMKYNRLFSAGGHIHKHVNIQDKIFYINSLTTHNFSDVGNRKGYMEFTIQDDKSWSWGYIVNDKAPAFVDHKINDIHLISKDDIRNIIGNILIMRKQGDKVRFTITGEEGYTSTNNVAFIRALMKRYDIKIITKYKESIASEEETEDMEFFSDPSVSIDEKIKKIIDEEYHTDISLKEIQKYIKIGE